MLNEFRLRSDYFLISTRVTARVIAALPLLTAFMHISTALAAEPVEVRQLMKTTQSWDAAKYLAYPAGQPEITVLDYKIPEHSALPWHTHPVINAAYIVSGHLTVIRRSDGMTKVVGPGEVLPEMVDAIHRGQTGAEPVELIVFYVGIQNSLVKITEMVQPESE